MSTLPLSEVKAHLSEIADEVDRTHERVHVTRNGREYVVLVAAEDLASLEATLELLSDRAGIERVREAESAVERGEGISAEEMAQLMHERRQRDRNDG
jgi:antitoxin YefM